jgi:hypothetical protein
VTVPSILLSDGPLVFVTQGRALFAGSISLSRSESVDLAIPHGHLMTENKTSFSGPSNPFLHFERTNDAPNGRGPRGAFYRRDMSGVSLMNLLAWAV